MNRSKGRPVEIAIVGAGSRGSTYAKLARDLGATASLTVTAFAPMSDRMTRIGGTEGYLEGNGESITQYRYRDGSTTTVEVQSDSGPDAATGHGGGDRGLIEAFVDALRTGEWANATTGAVESLRTHQIVWAAERARTTRSVVSLSSGHQTIERPIHRHQGEQQI